jgi:hypothetical protein
MGRTCHLCGRDRPNEHFGGKGLRKRICKTCRSRPKTEIKATLELEEISGFLDQINISKKNIARLKQLTTSSIPEVTGRATVVLDIALIAPGKRHRIRKLRRNGPHLIAKLQDLDFSYYSLGPEYVSEPYEYESEFYEAISQSYGLIYELGPFLTGEDFEYGQCPARDQANDYRSSHGMFTNEELPF